MSLGRSFSLNYRNVSADSVMIILTGGHTLEIYVNNSRGTNECNGETGFGAIPGLQLKPSACCVDGFAPRTVPDIVPRDADVQDQNALSSEKRGLLQTLWKASFRRQSLCPIGLIVAKSHIRLSHSN